MNFKNKISYLACGAYCIILKHKSTYVINQFFHYASLQAMGILDGGEEKNLADFLNGKKKPIIFDVGANVGTWSESLMKINPTAILFAFEPNPAAFRKLNRIKAQNFSSFNLGLSSTASTLDLYFPKDNLNSVHSSLYADAVSRGEKGIGKVKVKVDTLDRFCAKNKVNHIDFLKIDTEGNELQILKGAKRLISEGRIDAIQFEFNQMNIQSRTFFKDFIDILGEYTFFRVASFGLLPLDKYSPIKNEIFAYQNIFAVKKKP